MTPDGGLVEGPGGWWLAPEGAVVHRGEGVVVVADVHLGYEWSRGEGGDVVPAHSLAETKAKLDRLLDRAPVGRLVVAGDLLESPRPCRRTAGDLRRLVAWLGDRGVRLELVLGNHDPQRRPGPPLSLEVGGWTVAHGHRPVDAPRTITGHHHPALRLGRTAAPCLLVGPSAIVLPAFSGNAAGLNVAQGPVPAAWKGRSFRCWAGGGSRLLDFGNLDDLPDRVAGLKASGPAGR